jgi:hypothetical protein
MSRDLIPRHLQRELRAKADPECQDCGGEGYVTFTARNHLGYTEVRCACVGRERETETHA